MRPSPLERLLLLWRLFEPPNLPELPRRNCFLRAFAGDESTATGGESAVQGGISVLKAVDRYLRKFRLKSGANQVDLGKAAETAVDLYEHCTLVLFNGTK